MYTSPNNIFHKHAIITKPSLFFSYHWQLKEGKPKYDEIYIMHVW